MPEQASGPDAQGSRPAPTAFIDAQGVQRYRHYSFQSLDASEIYLIDSASATDPFDDGRLYIGAFMDADFALLPFHPILQGWPHPDGTGIYIITTGEGPDGEDVIDTRYSIYEEFDLTGYDVITTNAEATLTRK